MASKMITLRSSEGAEFVVEEKVAMRSQTIRHMIEEGCIENGVPLHNVTSNILTKVIEYCKKHVDDDDNDDAEALKSWDNEFVMVDQNTLFDLILAANYLDIKGLLDLTCRTVAEMMKGKNSEEIRQIFHIKNDYSPEEEAEVRRENHWAFD